MDCAICYEASARPCKLMCGHAFCHGCIRAWCVTGTGCPMCRRTIYFRGIRKLYEEATAKRFTDIIEKSLEAVTVCVPAECMMLELLATERTFRMLMSEGFDASDIEYVMHETDFYFSDRRIGAKNQYRECPAGPGVERWVPAHRDIMTWYST